MSTLTYIFDEKIEKYQYFSDENSSLPGAIFTFIGCYNCLVFTFDVLPI